MLHPGLLLSVVGGTNNFPTWKMPFKNVTASALVKYGVYQLDLDQSDGDVTTTDLALSSVVAVATAGIAKGILVVSQTALAAGASGEFVIWGVTKIRADGTTDIAKMDVLKAQNADFDVVEATAGTDRWHGILLEAATEATDERLCFWDGFGRF